MQAVRLEIEQNPMSQGGSWQSNRLRSRDFVQFCLFSASQNAKLNKIPRMKAVRQEIEQNPMDEGGSWQSNCINSWDFVQIGTK